MIRAQFPQSFDHCGKRGGLRVIYYRRMQPGQVWMLTLYAKNVAENIPAHVLRQIKDEVDGEDCGKTKRRTGNSGRTA